MSPIRRGRVKTLTLEFEAVEILERLCLNTRSQGLLISSLIRAEERKRDEMKQRRARRYAEVDEVLQP